MVKYIVTGSKVVFGTGLVLGLSDEQAKISQQRRNYYLRPL